MTRPGVACLVALLAGCGRSGCDLERMIDQDRYQAYQASDLFPDGRAMRTPPAGSVARESHSAELDAPGDGIPVPITRELLELGRARFERVCAVCHGLTGDGTSVVADRMQLRRPPSLLGGDLGIARIYRAIDQGYGLMPGFAWMLPVRERWAVVAYQQALVLSQRAPAAALPPELRRRLP